MKLCFSSLGCPDDTVDELIARLQRLGVQGVELRTVESTIALWEIDAFKPENLVATRKKFEDADITVVVVGTSGSFADADPEKRAIRVEMLARYASIAAGLGCPYLRVFGGPLPTGATREETVTNNIEGYQLAMSRLKAYGVSLLFETHDDFSRSEWMLPLLEALPGTGVIWDILHPYRFGEDMAETARQLAPYVRHVHIKDATTFSAQTFDIAHIGEGNVPIDTALQLLKKAKYDGFICYEWEKHWHPEIDSADVAFPRYIQYMRERL